MSKEKQKKSETTSQQILTRSRVREHNKNEQRNAWLNRAIVIIVILLVILLYAIFKL